MRLNRQHSADVGGYGDHGSVPTGVVLVLMLVLVLVVVVVVVMLMLALVLSWLPLLLLLVIPFFFSSFSRALLRRQGYHGRLKAYADLPPSFSRLPSTVPFSTLSVRRALRTT